MTKPRPDIFIYYNHEENFKKLFLIFAADDFAADDLLKPTLNSVTNTRK